MHTSLSVLIKRHGEIVHLSYQTAELCQFFELAVKLFATYMCSDCGDHSGRPLGTLSLHNQYDTSDTTISLITIQYFQSL